MLKFLGLALAVVSVKAGLYQSWQQGNAWQPQHVPVLGKNGVPLDTPEVQQAKAAHLQAVALAQAKQGWNQGLQYNQLQHFRQNELGYQNLNLNSLYKNQGWNQYHGPQHIPVIGKDGVPLETPEVALAKQQHLLAHAQESLKHSAWQPESSGWNGDSYQNGYGSQDGSYAYASIAGHLGDSKSETSVLQSGHAKIVKTSNEVKHEPTKSQGWW